MQVEQVIEEIVKLCKLYKVEEAILFGSRAKGTHRERSDIDIAVSGTPDFDGLAQQMEELPTLYSIDLLDLDTCGNALLMEDIREYGRKIYQKV